MSGSRVTGSEAPIRPTTGGHSGLVLRGRVHSRRANEPARPHEAMRSQQRTLAATSGAGSGAGIHPTQYYPATSAAWCLSSEFAVGRDWPPDCFKKAEHHGEPEAGPSAEFLGGEERLEYSRKQTSGGMPQPKSLTSIST